MSIDLHPDVRINAVLNAALIVFARYGFKRVCMQDIAAQAGLSRPLLYLSYPNKTAIFDALARAMADRACALCQAAWPQTEGFEKGLTGSALAMNLDAWRLIKGSPHGGELIASNVGVVAEVSHQVDVYFTDIIETRLRDHGQNPDLARMIVAALHGIKDKASSEDELVCHVAKFAHVVSAGL